MSITEPKCSSTTRTYILRRNEYAECKAGQRSKRFRYEHPSPRRGGGEVIDSMVELSGIEPLAFAGNFCQEFSASRPARSEPDSRGYPGLWGSLPGRSSFMRIF